MTLGLNSSHEVSGAAHRLPSGAVSALDALCRLEGLAAVPTPSVEASIAALRRRAQSLGAVDYSMR